MVIKIRFGSADQCEYGCQESKPMKDFNDNENVDELPPNTGHYVFILMFVI